MQKRKKNCHTFSFSHLKNKFKKRLFLNSKPHLYSCIIVVKWLILITNVCEEKEKDTPWMNAFQKKARGMKRQKKSAIIGITKFWFSCICIKTNKNMSDKKKKCDKKNSK